MVEPGHDGQLLYAGRIEKLKGLPTLLKAVGLTGSKLLIAGDGSWVPELKMRLRNLPNVRYLGFLTGPDLHAAMSRARAVVVPSEWYENCPMSVLEAKAAGRPVIGARIGGIPELVQDGVDGFLHTPGDAEDLAAALRRLEAAPFATLSRNARQDVMDRFSTSQHLARLMRVYAEAAELAGRSDQARCRSKAPLPTPKPAVRSGSGYR